MPAQREHDVVLFGGSGFAGGLTAEYLARAAPANLRWALAGRNPAKLEALRTRLAGINPHCAELPLLSADVGDPASLRAIAGSAKVVATTVGPYTEYGEPLVAACAEAGTGYLDLCGEPEFVDRMYLGYHETARRTGARIVHACGYDSIPHDLGAYFTVRQLPTGQPIRITAQVRVGATFSGGTYSSALTGFSRLRESAKVAKLRGAAERSAATPTGRQVRVHGGRLGRDGETGHWLVPMPTLDPQIVGRSARALDAYGPDFEYTQYAAVKWLPTLVAGGIGLGTVFALAQLPPARRLLAGLRKAGEGPDEQRRAKSWFSVRFAARSGDRRVVTEVSGGDPGYDETARMLGEAAICLATDELPETSGQVTTAQAMGDALLDRLIKSGLSFTVHQS